MFYTTFSRRVIGTVASVCLMSAILATDAAAAPAFSPISYQGHLDQNGAPANGVFDFEFVLFDADTGGNQMSGVLSKEDLQVTDGIFSTSLDFLNTFQGNDLWLEISVRDGASVGSFSLLSGRVQLLPVPMAYHAVDSSTLEGQPASSFAQSFHSHSTLSSENNGHFDRVKVRDDGAVEVKSPIEFNAEESFLSTSISTNSDKIVFNVQDHFVSLRNATDQLQLEGGGNTDAFIIGGATPPEDNLDGTRVQVRGGIGSLHGSGAGGDLQLIAGSSAGLSSGAGGRGGDTLIEGGDALGTGTNNGGNVTLRPGFGINGGDNGYIDLDGRTYIERLVDANNSEGTNGQFLSKQPSGLEWTDLPAFPTIPDGISLDSPSGTENVVSVNIDDDVVIQNQLKLPGVGLDFLNINDESLIFTNSPESSIVGGNLQIIAGSGAGLNSGNGGKGGDALLRGGDAGGTGSHVGGNVTIRPGFGSNGASHGIIELDGRTYIERLVDANDSEGTNGQVLTKQPSGLEWTDLPPFPTIPDGISLDSPSSTENVVSVNTDDDVVIQNQLKLPGVGLDFLINNNESVITRNSPGSITLGFQNSLSGPRSGSSEGTLTINAQDAVRNGSEQGSFLTLRAGNGSGISGGTGGFGGDVVIEAGAGFQSGKTGGNIRLEAGTGELGADGGEVRISGKTLIDSIFSNPVTELLQVRGVSRFDGDVLLDNSEKISNEFDKSVTISSDNTNGLVQVQFESSSRTNVVIGNPQFAETWIQAPSIATDGNGVAMNIAAGSAEAIGTGSGGSLNLYAGNASAGGFTNEAGGDGGNVALFAGDAQGSGNNDGGDIYLIPGDNINNGLDGSIRAQGNISINTFAKPAFGKAIDHVSGAFLSTAGVWQNASDVNRKTDFADVDAQEVLAGVLNLPVKQWRYNEEESSVVHLGPTAQDFKAAFGLGTSDVSIGTVDADGVALAAIKGLHQVSQKRISDLEEQNRQLKERLTMLEEAVLKLSMEKQADEE